MIGYQPPLTDILVTEIPTGENSPKVTGNFSEKPFSNWNIILLNVLWRRSCRAILEILRNCVSPSAVSRPLVNPSWSDSITFQPPSSPRGRSWTWCPRDTDRRASTICARPPGKRDHSSVLANPLIPLSAELSASNYQTWLVLDLAKLRWRGSTEFSSPSARVVW